MNVIDEREERTIKRKLAKRKFDDLINLSTAELRHRNNTLRLLDEGAVVMDSESAPYCYIKKGTLERALQNMPDDYENYIDLGHMPFETFPISLGVMRKSDLQLVETGNGRHGLDVDVHLDYNNPIVKALQMQPYDLAISARFTYGVNEEDTRKISEMLGAYVEVIDEVNIKNFAVVGEPGNVNSGGLKLKGEFEAVDNLKELAKALEDSKDKEIDLSMLTEALDDILGGSEEEELSEEVAEEEVEELSEEVEEEEEEEELSAEEEAEEPDAFALALEKIEALTKRVEELEAKNAELEADKSALQDTLNAKDKAEKAKEKEFIAKLASCVVAKEEPKKVVTYEPVYTDGFGE